MTNMVIKFDPQGRVAHAARPQGRRPFPFRRRRRPAAPPRRRPGGGLRAPGAQSDVFNRPTDVAWDAAGNIFVADGIGNARVAKFDKNGVFVKSWGSKGTEPGQFDTVRAHRGRCAGQCLCRRRRQQAHPGLRQQRHLQDAVHQRRQLRRRSASRRGRIQFLYVSNSNPPNDIDVAGEIYKMKLDGTIVGKFGRAGKLPKEFGTVNAIDCRTENTLLVGEIGNLRVQKLTLH